MHLLSWWLFAWEKYTSYFASCISTFGCSKYSAYWCFWFPASWVHAYSSIWFSCLILNLVAKFYCFCFCRKIWSLYVKMILGKCSSERQTWSSSNDSWRPPCSIQRHGCIISVGVATSLEFQHWTDAVDNQVTICTIYPVALVSAAR